MRGGQEEAPMTDQDWVMEERLSAAYAAWTEKRAQSLLAHVRAQARETKERIAREEGLTLEELSLWEEMTD
jgi:hypothetical protein